MLLALETDARTAVPPHAADPAADSTADRARAPEERASTSACPWLFWNPLSRSRRTRGQSAPTPPSARKRRFKPEAIARLGMFVCLQRTP